MKVMVLNQTSNKFTIGGGTVYRVEILEPKQRRKVGYIMLGVSLPWGHIIERDEEEVYRTQAEAFKQKHKDS